MIVLPSSKYFRVTSNVLRHLDGPEIYILLFGIVDDIDPIP
jgi:hypothetical protein